MNTNAKNFYFELVLKYQSEEGINEALTSLAYEKYNCDGVVEFALEEEEIDSLLGEEAFMAADASLQTIESLEARLELKKQNEIKIYFDQNKRTELIEFILEINHHYFGIEIEIFQHPYEDWIAKWRDSFQILPINSEIEIVPSWQKQIPSSKKYPLYIYPAFGFGTGHHETTRLCLQAQHEILCASDDIARLNVLDFGCGSGILGILALKEGVKEVHFCDVSKDALENTKENLLFNDLLMSGERFQILERSELKDNGKYHLVLANILLSVLIEEASFIKNHLLPGGYLILSGIFSHQVDEVMQHYRDLEFIGRSQENDWCALKFKKL